MTLESDELLDALLDEGADPTEIEALRRRGCDSLQILRWYQLPVERRASEVQASKLKIAD